MEQADGVARRGIAEAGQELVGDGCAADLFRRFEHGDLQALPGEIVSAGEAVVARTDDDGVVQIP